MYMTAELVDYSVLNAFNLKVHIFREDQKMQKNSQFLLTLVSIGKYVTANQIGFFSNVAAF